MIKINLTIRDILSLLDIRSDSVKTINFITPLETVVDNSLFFINKPLSVKLTEDISLLRGCLILSKDGLTLPAKISNDNLVVYSDNPRIAIAKILTYIDKNSLYTPQIDSPSISKNAIISQTSRVGKNVVIEDGVVIEDFCYIGENVKISKNSLIKSGVKIVRNATIGCDTIIRENSIIGGNGFGVEKDQNNNNFKIPHLGGVSIGNNVEVGALNTVCAGTFSPTIIEDYVKIDDHCHIAHNVKISRNSIITAGTIFSGSVICDQNVWIGPNSTIIQKTKIGESSVIGIGSVVVKDLDENTTVFGNPARKTIKFDS